MARNWAGGGGPRSESWRSEVGKSKAVRGGLKTGERTTKSMKTGQKRVRPAHLREFAFICGPFRAFWGAPEGREAGFLPQMDANGHEWGLETGQASIRKAVIPRESRDLGLIDGVGPATRPRCLDSARHDRNLGQSVSIRVHPWLDRGSKARKEAKTA